MPSPHTGRRKDSEKRARRILSSPSEFFFAEHALSPDENAALTHFFSVSQKSPPTQMTTTKALKKKLKVRSEFSPSKNRTYRNAD
jgi:hypothetical protein